MDLEELEGRRRVRESDQEKRDLLIYLLWENRRFRRREIGDLFGLGYSSVSRRAGMMKARMSQDESLRRGVRELKSIFKV